MALFLKIRNASLSQCEHVFFNILEAFDLKILENRGCLCAFAVTVDFFVCKVIVSVFNNFPQFSWNQLCIAEERESFIVSGAFQSRSAIVSYAEFQRLPSVSLAIF